MTAAGEIGGRDGGCFAVWRQAHAGEKAGVDLTNAPIGIAIKQVDTRVDFVVERIVDHVYPVRRFRSDPGPQSGVPRAAAAVGARQALAAHEGAVPRSQSEQNHSRQFSYHPIPRGNTTALESRISRSESKVVQNRDRLRP